MSASFAAYHLRVRDLIEQLSREDPDAYVNVSTGHEDEPRDIMINFPVKGRPHDERETPESYRETEPLAGIVRHHDSRRYVELRGDC